MSVNVNPDAFDDDAFPDELRPGTELLHGQYVIEKFLNSGGFGITYLAKDSLDRTVVIKECFPGSFCRRTETIVTVRSRAHSKEFSNIVKLFVQEAKNLAKLKHPNIVGVHQIFEDNETAYMALDYVQGRDLLDIIEDPNDALTAPEIQSMTHKLLSAVEYIHKAGVLHRDVSPDNILIDRKTGEPVLIDFGAAREEATRQTRLLSAMRVVKDGYSPQEFYIQGSQQDPSSDLYALAATLYHVITGECPPDSQSRLAAVAAQKLDPYRAFPNEVPGYDPKFLKAINQAMNIFPYDRIQTAAEWAKFITPEPEIVALPSAKKVTPTRPTSIKADESELEDHAAGNALAPVPAMVPADAEAASSAEAKLNVLRDDAPAEKKSSMGLLLGGVAAVVLIGAAGAVFLMPSGDTQTLAPVSTAQNAVPLETPAPVETTERAETADVVAVAPEQPAVNAVAPTEEPAEVAASQEGAAPSVEALEPAALDANDAQLADIPATEPAQAPAAIEVSEPTGMADMANLPAISAPAPNAEDVVVNEVATVAEAPAVLPEVEQIDPAATIEAAEAPKVEAEAVAEPVEVAEQEVVIALAPPKEPLTVAPAMAGEKVTGFETVVPAFAVIETGELTTDRVADILKRDTSVADALPAVDVVSAEPLPEPEPVVEVAVEETVAPETEVASASSAFETKWLVNVPFTGKVDEPNVVATVSPGAPEWMKPGQKIVAINGVKLAAISEIVKIVEQNVEVNETSKVDMAVLVLQPGETTVEIQQMSLRPAHSIALENGFRFSTIQDGEEWRTIVAATPDAGENDLRQGDRLVAYIPTNERLDRQNTLSEIFERELGNGTSQFAFAVNRDGQLWIASLGYEGKTGE